MQHFLLELSELLFIDGDLLLQILDILVMGGLLGLEVVLQSVDLLVVVGLDGGELSPGVG